MRGLQIIRPNLDARCGLGAARNPRVDRGGRAMMRDVDADDDAASAASSLDDLPGPDEFLATAIQKLALKVTPERASPGGGARGRSGSPAGASLDSSGVLQLGDDAAAASRASSMDYDDEEREAVVHFLAAAASPLRQAAPRDDRPANSPKRAMEEMTASLKIEHMVTEAVVEDILDEAEMRAAYPAASGGVDVESFEGRAGTSFPRADAEAQTKEGFRPIHIAAQFGKWQVLEQLIQRGKADVHARCPMQDSFPLLLAVNFDHVYTIGVLLDFLGTFCGHLLQIMRALGIGHTSHFLPCTIAANADLALITDILAFVVGDKACTYHA